MCKLLITTKVHKSKHWVCQWERERERILIAKSLKTTINKFIQWQAVIKAQWFPKTTTSRGKYFLQIFFDLSHYIKHILELFLIVYETKSILHYIIIIRDCIILFYFRCLLPNILYRTRHISLYTLSNAVVLAIGRPFTTTQTGLNSQPQDHAYRGVKAMRSRDVI